MPLTHGFAKATEKKNCWKDYMCRNTNEMTFFKNVEKFRLALLDHKIVIQIVDLVHVAGAFYIVWSVCLFWDFKVEALGKSYNGCTHNLASLHHSPSAEYEKSGEIECMRFLIIPFYMYKKNQGSKMREYSLLVFCNQNMKKCGQKHPAILCSSTLLHAYPEWHETLCNNTCLNILFQFSLRIINDNMCSPML